MTLEKYVKQEAILNMADFLMGYGFKPKDALKVSESFWKKHRKKLKDVLA